MLFYVFQKSWRLVFKTGNLVKIIENYSLLKMDTPWLGIEQGRGASMNLTARVGVCRMMGL